MTEQICTNIEQSKRLMELGLREDTADLYITMKGGDIKTICSFKTKDSFPSWSLAKLVEIVKDVHMPHPEVWHDVDFFEEIFNEVCHALADFYCRDYWSNEKHKQAVDPKRNRWSEFAADIKRNLPKIFQCKFPDRKELIAFFEHEGSWNRDNRIGRIYRTAAKELKDYDKRLSKPRLMLQWSRNDYGYHHLSAWALNDKDEGCFEYSVAVGVNKPLALWHLVCRMHRMGWLHLLRYVVKQKVVSSIPGRVKYFKIEKVTDTFYLIRQRHTLMFFLHWYDSGAELLCPDYRKSSRSEARDFIAVICCEKGYDYRIKDV